jgi:hypothetical protein
MMRHGTRITGGPLREHRRPGRGAAAVITTAALALLAVACGGGGRVSSAGSEGSPVAVSAGALRRSISTCPREGRPQQVHRCMQGSDCAQAVVHQMMIADPKLARCMRSHGVPSFPDPSSRGSGGPVLDITRAGISGAASHAGLVEAALTTCGRLAGPNAPESLE